MKKRRTKLLSTVFAAALLAAGIGCGDGTVTGTGSSQEHCLDGNKRIDCEESSSSQIDESSSSTEQESSSSVDQTSSSSVDESSSSTEQESSSSVDQTSSSSVDESSSSTEQESSSSIEQSSSSVEQSSSSSSAESSSSFGYPYANWEECMSGLGDQFVCDIWYGDTKPVSSSSSVEQSSSSSWTNDELWQECIENGFNVLECDFWYPRSSSSAASSSSGKPKLEVGTFENFAECNEYYTENECLSVDPGIEVVESTEFYGVHKCINKLTGKSRGGLFNDFNIEYVDGEHLKLNSFIMGKQDVLRIEVEEMVYENKPYIYPDEIVPRGFTRCNLDVESVGAFAAEI